MSDTSACTACIGGTTLLDYRMYHAQIRTPAGTTCYARRVFTPGQATTTHLLQSDLSQHCNTSFVQGWDKTYCLQFVQEFEEVHFFGDKTFEVRGQGSQWANHTTGHSLSINYCHSTRAEHGVLKLHQLL